MNITRDEIIKSLRTRAMQNGDEHADSKMLALADVYEKGGIDHLRLVRVERMLEFLLRKQQVEIPRRPSMDELKAYADAELVAPAKIVDLRTWLDEFNTEHQAFISSLQIAPAALTQGDSNGQE